MRPSQIFRAHRGSISLSYGLTVAEKACLLALPALTGLAIDELLARSPWGLLTLLVVWLAQLFLGWARQCYDTRVFTGIYAELAQHTAMDQSERGESLSRIAGRVGLAREVVDFFEDELPAIAQNLLAVIGSLVMVFGYDREAGWIAACVLLPMGAANYWNGRKAARLQRALNGQIEREVDALASAQAPRLSRHFALLRRWRVALSDGQAGVWAITEGASVAALALMLWDFTHSPAFSAGAAYALIAYMRGFLDGLNDMPYVVNNLLSLRDVLRRLQT